MVNNREKTHMFLQRWYLVETENNKIPFYNKEVSMIILKFLQIYLECVTKSKQNWCNQLQFTSLANCSSVLLTYILHYIQTQSIQVMSLYIKIFLFVFFIYLFYVLLYRVMIWKVA